MPDQIRVFLLDRPPFPLLGRFAQLVGIATGLINEHIIRTQFIEERDNPARSPVSRDATTTTVVIPITIPRIVRPDRNLFVHTAVMAIVRFSLGASIYSALKATIGSSFEAFDAGYHPLATPTAPDTSTDSNT